MGWLIYRTLIIRYQHILFSFIKIKAGYSPSYGNVHVDFGEMKILQISSNWGHGGPGGVVKDLYNVIEANGDECKVAYGRFDIPDDVLAIRIGTKYDTYVHGLLSRIMDNAGFLSRRATTSFVQEIVKYDPDIIHLHNLLGYYINIEVLFDYLKTCGKPIIWTVHDCWPITGHCINFERIDCKKWNRGCHDCLLKKDYPPSYLVDQSRNNWIKKKEIFTGVSNMYLVSPSKWLSKLLNNSYMSCYPIQVINNGIDLSVFKPMYSNIRKKYGLENKIVLLAVAGVWNEMKGEKLLYSIASMLNDNYRLVMIGTKSPKILPANIISIDRTDNLQELVQWYTTADVFVNPTLGDNFPTVNIEAMACGTPVVTNATGGSSEAAGNIYGRIVQSKTADEFIQKILECISNRFDPIEITEAAKKYDKSRCFKKYIELYRSRVQK